MMWFLSDGETKRMSAIKVVLPRPIGLLSKIPFCIKRPSVHLISHKIRDEFKNDFVIIFVNFKFLSIKFFTSSPRMTGAIENLRL
jgi:hypothetical protein